MGKYADYKNNKGKKEEAKTSSSGGYAKFRLENQIGFDTFESDIRDVGTTINGIYDGWQTQETMNNTRHTVEVMKGRIDAYQTYQKKFGGTDLSDVASGYQSVLDQWDALTSTYGTYKNADAYKNATRNAQFDKDFAGLSYDEVQTKKREYSFDSPEYSYLMNYTGYSNSDDFEKAIASATSKKVKDKLTEAKNLYELDHAGDKYLEITKRDDFAETSKYASTIENNKFLWMDDRTMDETYEYINNVDGIRADIQGNYDANQSSGPVYNPSKWTVMGLSAMNDDEIGIYNYLYATEGKESAEKYLEDIEVMLTKRLSDAQAEDIKQAVDDSVLSSIALSAVSPILNVGGSIYSGIDSLGSALSGEKKNPYNIYNSGVNMSSAIRNEVSDNIAESTDWEIGGVNVPSFLYNTGMSMADSAVGAVSFGKAFTPLMGMSAYQQTAKELTEAGASEDEIFWTALVSGVAEAGFEYAGIDNLFKIKNTDEAVKILTNGLKQAGVEGLEEIGTEIVNITADTLIRGGNSEFSKKYDDLIARGYSESEANTEIAKEIGSRVAQAGIGGALSGGAMGGTYAGTQYHNLGSVGKELSANNRAQDVMDLSGLTPEESETYKLYSEYAKKGVTADNVKNAQLGNLYTTAENDAHSTLRSKKATPEQKASAYRNLGSLNTMMTTTKTRIADSGETVKIEGIKEVDGEKVLVTDKGEISANEVTLSKNDAQLMEYASGMDADKASLFMAQYDGTSDVDAYKASFDMAYAYGETGFGTDSVLKNKGILTEKQASEIYKNAVITKASAQQKAIDEVNTKYGKTVTVAGTFNDSVIDYNSATTDGSKVNWNSLTTAQRDAITFAKGFSNATGMNIALVKSDVVNGKHTGKNGSYNPATNTIEIDVYAGRVDASVLNDSIIPTLSHEMTHWMKAKSPAMYSKMREHIMETLAIDGKLTSEERVAQEMERIRKSHPDTKVTEEMAIDEIMARACEDMLSNSDTARKMLNRMTKQEQNSFIAKVKETFDNLMEWVNELLARYKSTSEEAKVLRQYKERLKQLSKMWDKALTEAVQTNQSLQKEGITGEEAINRATEKVGVAVDMETESAYPSEQLSERTWTESEYVQNKEVAVKALVKAIGVTEADAERYIDNINSIAKMIADDRERLDYEPNIDEYASVLKTNKEYKWTVDMSTLCAKRLLFTGTFDAIQKALPNTAFDSDDIVGLRSLMMSRGYEVACGICYVESTRRELGTITADFIERYKLSQKTGKPITKINSKGEEIALRDRETKKDLYADKDYTPTLAELNTTDIDLVKRDHPNVYSAYLSYMKARGQAIPKLLETRAEYKGEILKHFNKSAVKSRNDAGGLRVQSFSDFEVAHLIDMMQITLDMSRVGLMSQAYTKVPAFAEVFGDTGIKINLSLIAKDSGIDENGNLIFDDVEGINHEEAFRLRDKYSKNVGTILVGKNDNHIIKAMADPRIDYIIPFHKSFWKESLYDALGLTGYSDYAETQNEKSIDKDRTIKNFQPSEYWDYSKTGEENAQVYLKMCKEDGRIPKFPQFQGYEGYWKLLIDFKMYDNDGVGSPQTAVQPNFNMEGAMEILNSYDGGHQSFPVAEDIVKDFVEEYKNNHPQEQYSDREYLDAVNRGDMETAQKMVDEKALELGARTFPNGRLINYYHGTRNTFTSFDIEKAREGVHGFGFYFSPMKSKAEDYKYENGNLISAYIFTDKLARMDSHNLNAEDVEKVLNDFNVPTDEQEWLWHGYDSIADWLKEDSDRVALKEIEKRIYRNSDASVGEILNALRNTLGYDGIQAGNETILFDNKLMKSADPVTYDDNGNVIPLSKRFDSSDADIRYSDREVTTLTDEDYKNAKKHFGTTGNFNVAGYMLKDGYMLDFSGKHWGDTTSRSRQVDHRDIQEAIPDDNNGFDSMVNMISNGNIRLMPEDGGINLAVTPTKEQRTVLRRYIEFFNGECVVDIDAVGGDTVQSFTYDRGTSADRIMKDIDNYFRGGRQSELMMFHTMYSDRVADKDTLDFLNEQIEDGEYVTVYRSFQIIDGGLYAPMNAVDRDEDGKNKRLGYRSELGQWEMATESPEIAQRYMDKNSNAPYAKFDLDGVDNKTNAVAYNPYLHASNLVLNDQFSGAYRRNLVTVECRVPLSEAGGAYHAKYAKDATGWAEWKAGTVAGKLTKVKPELTRKLFLSRYMLPVRIVPDSEVAQMYKGYLDGTDISVPWNVVTPSLRQELEKAGVNVSYNDVKFGSKVVKFDDVFGTQYSDRDNVSVYDVMGENEALKKQNDILKADIEGLKERLKLEKQVTHGNVFNEKQLGAVAKHLRNIAKSDYSEASLVDELREVYTYIVESPQLTWEDLMAKCYEVAQNVLKSSKGYKVTNDYFKSVLGDIRKARIALNEEQIQEAKSAYGERYRDAFMGRIVLAKNGISLDEQWQEWSSVYPEIFDAEIAPAEQIIALSDIYDALREGAEMYHAYNDAESIRAFATEIYNQYWNVSTIRTTADKYDAQIKRLNYEHRMAMKELRDDYKKRVDDQNKADAIHYGKIISNLRQQRDERVKEAKQLGKKRMDAYKDRIARNAKVKSITEKALTLNKWLTKNSKEAHIPEVMKAPVAYLLNAIDFSSKQLLGQWGGDKAGTATNKDLSLSKALERVHDMVRTINSAQIGEDEITEIYGTFADFPMGFADDIKELSSSVNDIMRAVGDNAYVLNDMTLEQLETLDKIVTTIKATVTKMNKFLAIRHAEGVASLSKNSISYLDSLGEAKVHDGLLGKLDTTVNWGNALPYYTFKRFGEGGQKVYEALMDGWDKFAFHVRDIIDYAETAYTSDEVKMWSEDVEEFEILEPATDEAMSQPDYKPQYQKLKMSVPQIMSLYCLQKREQAKGHLMGGGMRVSDIQLKKEVISQTDGVILSESEIDTIINSLTPRQKEVADTLQEYMNTTCTDWGNEVSMLRFGYKAFGEENYFPIHSDKNNLAVNDETENNNSLFRLLNMSFTKSTDKKANNRIVVSDIFDVFAQHSSDMAKYNALALPVLDSFKWYNYKEKIKKGETQFTTKSLKRSLENAFGKDAQSYFVTFLKDINGERNVGRDTLGNGFFTNAKLASVGFNLKVVALQPTSYLRASAVIDNKYLSKAFARTPKIDLAQKWSGIAQWKALGYYDTNIQRNVAEQIAHKETTRDKIVEFSMKGAEVADKVTWGYLWNACEYEVRDTHKNLRVGSDEYYQTVAKRLREVIYSTQVVDSTMTRSQMMRSSDGRDKVLTAFASEPTLAYNMLQDCYYDWKLTERQTGSKSKALKKHGKKMARVFTAYAVTNAITALVESGFQIFRDDDDEEMTMEEFMKMYFSNFGVNMSILGKIPYAKEAISLLQGYTSTRTETQWMQYFIYTAKGIGKIAEGEGNVYTTAKNALRSLSYATGLPVYNLIRDVFAIWNDTIGEAYPSLKIK